MIVFPSLALIRREFLTSLRRTLSLVWLVLLLGACVFVAVTWWPSRNLSWQEIGYVSQEILFAVSVVLFVGGILFMPAIAAGAIVIEKEQNTFDLVRMSLVRPTSILVAKLVNTVGFFFLLVLATMPVLAVVMLGVGVDQTQFALAVLAILATGTTCAVIGLLSSALFRRGFLAVAGSYAGVLIFLFVPALVLAPIPYVVAFVGSASSESISFGAVAEMSEEIAIVFCPLLAFDAIFKYPMTPRDIFIYGGSALLYQFTVCVVCLVLARVFFLRPARPSKIESEKIIDSQAVLKMRRTSFPFYLIDPLRRKKTIGDARNPMCVRELQWGLFNRGTILVRVFYCVFPICVFTAFEYAGSRSSMTIWLVAEIVLLLGIAPALLANLGTKEHELGNIDMLNMTLLSFREIVLGKAAAGVATLVPLLVAAMLPALVFLVVLPRDWFVLAVGEATLLVCVFASLSITLFASMLARRTSTALMLGYGLSLLVFAGLPIAHWFVMYTFSRADSTYGSFLYNLPYLSPIAAFADPPAALRHGLHRVAYWSGTSGLFLLASCGLLVASVGVFAHNRREGR